MPLPPITNEAKSRRRPGQLPNVLKPLEEAKTALDRAPDAFKKALAPSFASIVDAGRVQNRLNAMLWAALQGLPGKHGSTHRDGDDNIASSNPPTSIGLTSVTDPGTPHEALSRGDHQHALTDDIVGILDGIGAIAIDPIDGMAVTDNVLRRLLEDILVGLLEVEKALMSCLPSRNQVVTAPTPFNVTSVTSEVALFGTNSRRAGFVLQNASTAVLFVKFGPGVSSTSYTYSIVAGASVESSASYTGPVTATWAAANGFVACTELVFENR